MKGKIDAVVNCAGLVSFNPSLETLALTLVVFVAVLLLDMVPSDDVVMETVTVTLVVELTDSLREARIVIVHGTDTMRDTAAVLGAAALAKTIVLTGAMVPYEIAESDALFNLGFAIAAAQLSAPGVWVAMNGQVFAWNDVRKNRAAGVFERTD